MQALNNTFFEDQKSPIVIIFTNPAFPRTIAASVELDPSSPCLQVQYQLLCLRLANILLLNAVPEIESVPLIIESIGQIKSGTGKHTSISIFITVELEQNPAMSEFFALNGAVLNSQQEEIAIITGMRWGLQGK
ncbi:MAG: hypothetical protein Q7T51_03145 [Candidatus Moranbacteria bacterium]|nr:hypothetical protein [Candidatus Moranbacteria bacterium]